MSEHTSEHKLLPEEVVISPQDSVPVPQLGGAAHEGAVYTGPEGTPGGRHQLDGKEQ